MTKDRVIVVATGPYAVARLLRPLGDAGFAIDVWTPFGSRIAFSRDVRHVNMLAESAEARARQYPKIARTVAPDDWVILGSDQDLYEVWDATALNPECLRLLPFRDRSQAVGSKDAMFEALHDLGVSQPRTVTVTSSDDLAPAIEAVGGDAVLKPIRGYGGRGVIRLDGSAIPQLVGAHLVQEWIEGASTSVELLVVDGRIAMAPYSVCKRAAPQFGPTSWREYRPLPDQRLRADLAAIAAGFGGTWFGNLTFIRRPDGSHSLVELDPRPNSWHAHVPLLGYDLAGPLGAVKDGLDARPPQVAQGTHREAINATRVAQAWLSGHQLPGMQVLLQPSSWRNLPRGDFALSRRELRDLARWLIRSASHRGSH